MRNPTCATCRWWHDYDDPDPVSGGCHRHAPRPKLSNGEEDYDTYWPCTQAEDFCGEHSTIHQPTILDVMELSAALRASEKKSDGQKEAVE